MGFNKGTLLEDPHHLLTGTGKFIRHIPIRTPKDYRNKQVGNPTRSAIDLADKEMDKQAKSVGMTISKIK